jgi:putative serine protease PepD
VGGLIVRATWGSGTSNGSKTTAGTAAACDAAKVAGNALQSVVTVRAGSGQGESSGSGVVIRPGGYVLTNDHVDREPSRSARRWGPPAR